VARRKEKKPTPRPSRQPNRTNPVSPIDAPSRNDEPLATTSNRDSSIALAVAAFTIAVFLPALRNDFVNWDDYDLLVNNPYYRGLGWQQLAWMFSTFHQGHYQPLSWITLAVDYYLWGLNPVGYHLTNILLHGANAALFFLIAQKLLSVARSTPATDFGLRAAAGLAALFFAVHPLRVESVAWATERRDVLSGLFFLATVYCYLRAVIDTDDGARQSRGWLGASVLCFACSLLAKASGVTLPLVLLLLDVCPLGRITWLAGRALRTAPRHVWLEKVPFALLALLAGIVAPLAQSDAAAVASLHAHGLAARAAQASYGLVFYLWKTVWPFDLAPLYEVPPRIDPVAWPFLPSAAVVIALSVGLWIFRRRWPAALACWLSYVVIVAPVLGFVQSGRQLVADRYSYLPCLGWALLVGAGWFFLWQRRTVSWLGSRKPAVPVALAAAMVVGLALVTIQQIAIWRDSDTLWNQVISVADRSTFKSATAHHMVARLAADRGDLDNALAHLKTSIAIEPNDYAIYTDLGVVLSRRGEPAEAIRALEQALSMKPTLAVSHYNLASALAVQGRLDEAIARLETALKLQPDYPQGYNALGKIYAAKGDLVKAIALFRRALYIRPDFAEAQHNLARALDEAKQK